MISFSFSADFYFHFKLVIILVFMFILCVCVCMCLCLWSHVCLCMYRLCVCVCALYRPEANLGYHSSVTVNLAFWNRVSCWHGACKVDQTIWTGSLSSPLALGVQAHITKPGFLHRFLGSNSGPEACTASTLPNELSPSPTLACASCTYHLTTDWLPAALMSSPSSHH